jgi:SAM-dependent methyltransferase
MRWNLRRLARRNLPIVAGALLLVLGWYFAFHELIQHRPPDAPFVTTPHDVVERMLDLADVRAGQMVYDLGCGDGRIVIAAARRGARGVGIDVDPERVAEARAAAERAGVQDRVRFRQADVFTLDLRDADVVTLFLLPTLNVRLMPQLEKLKPGARIVSHEFSMKGARPAKVIEVPSEEDHRPHIVYLWVTPWQKESERAAPRPGRRPRFAHLARGHRGSHDSRRIPQGRPPADRLDRRLPRSRGGPPRDGLHRSRRGEGTSPPDCSP